MEEKSNPYDNNARYTCDYNMCGKSYATRYALQHHMYVHTSLQPYRCSYCPLSFVSRHTKYNHIQKEHGQLHQQNQIKANLKPTTGRLPTVNSKEREINRLSTFDSTSFRKPLNPGQCPFCLNIYKHRFAVKVHISKVHRERFREYLQYFSDDEPLPAVEVDSDGTNVSTPSTSSSGSKIRAHTVMPSESSMEEDSCSIQEMLKPWFTSAGTKEDIRVDTNELVWEVPEPLGELMLCQFCNERFYDIKYLHWHIRNEHSLNLRSEPEESHNASSNMIPVRDIPIITSEPPLIPVHLDVKPDIRSFHKYKARIKPKAYTCHLCSKVFGNQLVLRRHIQLKQCQEKEMEQQDFCCGLCGNHFLGLGALLQHKCEAHLQPLLPMIDLAHSGPARNTLLNVQMPPALSPTDSMQTPTPDSVQYHCLFCPTSLTSDTGLLSHIRIKHKDITGKVKCPYCDLVAASPEDLFKHTRIHDEVRPYQCEACSKRFRTKESLKSHLLSHESTRHSHGCEICSKKYFYFSSLRRHMVTAH